MKIWNQDEGVLVTRVIATHETRSGQPAGTLPFIFFFVYYIIQKNKTNAAFSIVYFFEPSFPFFFEIFLLNLQTLIFTIFINFMLT